MDRNNCVVWETLLVHGIECSSSCTNITWWIKRSMQPRWIETIADILLDHAWLKAEYLMSTVVQLECKLLSGNTVVLVGDEHATVQVAMWSVLPGLWFGHKFRWNYLTPARVTTWPCAHHHPHRSGCMHPCSCNKRYHESSVQSVTNPELIWHCTNVLMA